jgi:tetrahydromethanopterin S-methyltransferase subunit F
LAVPLSEPRDPREVVDACLRTTHDLLGRAEEAGVTLRVVGSIGVRLHCPEFVDRLDAMDREAPPDIDLIIPTSDRRAFRAMLVGLGYPENRDVLVAMEGHRYRYTVPDEALHIDAFVDVLEFCHPIDLRERLHLDAPTIPLTDLVLEKLQIVEINQRDLKDLTVMFLEHDVGTAGREVIDLDYVAGLLARDWGFCYTVGRNVERLRGFVVGTPGLSDEERGLIARRLDALVDRVEAEPKSRRWRFRARVGTRVQWYRDVSELEATF